MHQTLLRLVCALLLIVAAPFAAAESSAKSKSAETSKSKSSAKIDVNTADQATLETLPGIGPSTARAIIAARPFTKIDELQNVPGIGPSKMAALRDHVRVSRPVAAKPGKSTDTAASRKSDRAKETARSERTTSAERHATIPAPAERRAAATTTGRSADVPPPPSTTSRDRTLEPTGFPSTTRSPAPTAAANVTGLVNLNTASKDQLESLPEIGPVKAQAIIDARPFSSVEDVMRVKGIKQGTFDVIKDRITVR